MNVVGNGTDICSNISKIRAQLGLTQSQFIDQLRAVSDGEYDMKSICTLSAIERGRRIPTVRDLISICKAFGVTMEQLCGLRYIDEVVSMEENNPSDTPKDGPVIPTYGAVLPKNMISSYDGLPVYVISKSDAFKEGWAILNSSEKALLFKNSIIPINSVDMDIYTYPPKERNFASGKTHQPLSLNGLRDMERVWVEMLCLDLYTQGRYNGWYKHNEFKECLINEGNGLTLPYSGLGISYNAFRINSDMSV